MDRLNKTDAAVFLNCRVLSVSERPVVQDYLEVATAVFVPRGVGKTSPRTLI